MKINIFLILLFLPHILFAKTDTIYLYSSRIESLIKPAFDLFTKKTGIKIKYTTAKEAVLLERLKSEGKYTRADLLITVDSGNLWLAKESGVLSSVKSKILEEQIPSSLRDPNGYWYGLTVRARTIIYNKNKVEKSELSTYRALGNKKWKNRLCLRTSKKVYNKSMVAAMIGHYGEKKTKKNLQAWMKNKPHILAKDSGVIKAISKGKCDVGIVNTYYLGRQLTKNPKSSVALFWANQKEHGTHVNISGIGVTKYSKHRKAALQLIEFLSSKEAQNLFADKNMEYPVNKNVAASPQLQKWWGKFKADKLNVSIAGKYQRKASLLMNKVGYK